jgi:hypothetical protein
MATLPPSKVLCDVPAHPARKAEKAAAAASRTKDPTMTKPHVYRSSGSSRCKRQ